MDKFQINVIISDITYMKDTFCIAGWDPAGRAMKRLLVQGKHWTEDQLKDIGQYASLLVNVIPVQKSRDYPHKTEDIWINDQIKVIKRYDDPAKLATDLKPSVSPTIAKAFHGELVNSEYVPAGTKCPSLGAITVPGSSVSFYNDENGKLRIKIVDSDKQIYDLRVTCKYLRDVLDKGSNTDDLNKGIEQKKAHIRIGLAKPFVHRDNNCYLMCNGIFFYE